MNLLQSSFKNAMGFIMWHYGIMLSFQPSFMRLPVPKLFASRQNFIKIFAKVHSLRWTRKLVKSIKVAEFALAKDSENVGLKALNERLNNGKSILNIGNTQTFITVFRNLDFFEMFGVALSLCYNSIQFLWCDMAHKNLLNNFLFITLNNEAYILRYLK